MVLFSVISGMKELWLLTVVKLSIFAWRSVLFFFFPFSFVFKCISPGNFALCWGQTRAKQVFVLLHFNCMSYCMLTWDTSIEGKSSRSIWLRINHLYFELEIMKLHCIMIIYILKNKCLDWPKLTCSFCFS